MRSMPLTLATTAILLGSAAAASAQPTTCAGTLSAGIYEGIVVPEGATCVISGAQVNGSLLALENSKTFLITTTVTGNIDAQDAEMLQMQNSDVHGNLDITGGDVDDNAPYTYDWALCGSRVRGNVSIQHTTGDVFLFGAPACGGSSAIGGNLLVSNVTGRVVLLDLTVHKNMTVRDNVSTAAIRVEHNIAGWNLTCTNNTGPLTAGPNSAGRKVIGQCF